MALIAFELSRKRSAIPNHFDVDKFLNAGQHESFDQASQRGESELRSYGEIDGARRAKAPIT